MIQRFEDVFPDTRIPTESVPLAASLPSSHSDDVEGGKSHATYSPDLTASVLNQLDAETAIDDEEDDDQYAVRLSRRSSNTSLHSRQLTSEEGQVHRLGQHLRRDILDSEENITQSSSADIDVAALREKLERLRDSQAQTRTDDPDSGQTLNEVGSSLEELLALQKQDPEAFADFKESQIAALINAGLGKKSDN